jgi:hypothetical protein
VEIAVEKKDFAGNTVRSGEGKLAFFPCANG